MNSRSPKKKSLSLCHKHLVATRSSARRNGALTLGLGLVVAGLTPLSVRSARAAQNDAYSTNATSGLFSTSFTLNTTTPTTGGTSSPASGDSLYFGTATTTTVSNDLSGFSFGGLTFNAGASAFTIGGNAFTLTGPIINNSASTQTINNAITLGANEAVNSFAGAVTLGGTISGSFVLAVTGPGAVTLGGTGNSVSGLTLGTLVSDNLNTNVASTGFVGTTTTLSNSQSVGAVLVGGGANVLNVGAGAAITTTTIANITTADRFTALNINLGAGASVTTNSTNTNGVISVGSQFNILTLNGTDFASNSTNAAGGSLVAATYTPSTATVLGTPAQNVSVVTDVAPTGNTTVNTIRFADTTGHTVTIGAANTLSLNGTGGTGGSILMAAGSGAVTNTITGGALYGTSNRGYSFLNYDTNAGASLVINSNLTNFVVSGSGVTATAAVLVAGGGKVVFGGSNLINGPLLVDGSSLSVGSDANLGGTNGTVSVTAATNASTSVTLAAAAPTTGSLVVGDVLLGQVISNIVGTTVTLASAYTGTSLATATTVGYVEGGSVNLNGGTLLANGTFSLSETNNTGSTATGLSTTIRNRSIGLGLKGGTMDVTSGNTLTIPGVISSSTGANATVGALTKTDSGTLAITGTGANTGLFLNNTAGTTILNKTSGIAADTVTVTGGTVQLGNPSVNTQQLNTLNVNGGTFDLNGLNAINTTIFGTLSGTGGTITNNGTTDATLYIGNSGATYNTNSTVASNITDGSTNKLNLNFQGNTASTRVVTFTGSNTYTGTTIIGAGTLAVAQFAGITGSPTITVNSGATFDTSAKGTAGFNVLSTQTVTDNGAVTGGFTVAGTLAGGTLAVPGTVSGATTISTGGTITGGGRGTVGALTLSNTLTLNGTYLADVLSGTGSDTLRLTGTGAAGVLTLGGASILTVAGTVDNTSTYVLATYASESGTFGSMTLPGGYSLSYGATELDLVPTAVPEPATVFGGLLLVGAFGWRQRRALGTLVARRHRHAV